MRREEKESNKKTTVQSWEKAIRKLRCCLDFSGIKAKEELFCVGNLFRSMKKGQDRNTGRGTVFSKQEAS